MLVFSCLAVAHEEPEIIVGGRFDAVSDPLNEAAAAGASIPDTNVTPRLVPRLVALLPP
jgi:hypothetical protein